MIEFGWDKVGAAVSGAVRPVAVWCGLTWGGSFRQVIATSRKRRSLSVNSVDGIMRDLGRMRRKGQSSKSLEVSQRSYGVGNEAGTRKMKDTFSLNKSCKM